MLLFEPFRPMLASFGKEAFADDEFLFDIKWGRRLLLHKQGSRMEAYTRFGRRVTEHFPELREAAAAVRAETAVLDGEGIVLREGRPGFDAYLHRLRVRNPVSVKQAMSTHPMTFVALDLLVSGAEELLQQPLEERKKRLQELVAPSSLVMVSPCVAGRGVELYAQAAERGLEGVVAKRRTSIYVPDTRSKEWIKIKVPQEIDCLILGYRPEPPFALVLGLHFPTVPAKPVGTVEQGISREEQAAFVAIARELHTRREGSTQWMQPRLCCRVQYRDVTEMHQLKQTEFRGFLPEKAPEDCWWNG